jgi:hypothetical protein
MTLEDILQSRDYLCAAICKHLARGEIESARFYMGRYKALME